LPKASKRSQALAQEQDSRVLLAFGEQGLTGSYAASSGFATQSSKVASR